MLFTMSVQTLFVKFGCVSDFDDLLHNLNKRQSHRKTFNYLKIGLCMYFLYFLLQWKNKSTIFYVRSRNLKSSVNGYTSRNVFGLYRNIINCQRVVILPFGVGCY